MALVKFLYLNQTEYYHQEQAATDEISLGKVTAVGVSGVAFDASGQLISNVATPAVGTDAANKDYVDAVANGLDWKASVRAVSTANITLAGAQTIDGVSVVAGDRVLVTGQTTSSQNGIWVVVDPGAWTRATDADANAEVTAGLATFVAEGTVYADSGWVLTTNDPIVVGTTNLTFTQFTGLGTINASAGLIKSGNVISVELDTAAGAQTTGADGGSSGLEFDISGDAGKLRAKVDPAGGIQRLAAGLALEIDDTPNTLDVDADGLKVVGLPSLFLINDVATGATVTAANLDDLTDGSNADTLHVHGRIINTWTSSGAIDKGDGVYFSANDTVSSGSPAADATARIIGVANATVATATATPVMMTGICTGVLSGATFNTPYYLGAGGAPVLAAAITGGQRAIKLGMAVNATDLFVQIFDYGKKAA